jgi:hypothetical protein
MALPEEQELVVVYTVKRSARHMIFATLELFSQSSMISFKQRYDPDPSIHQVSGGRRRSGAHDREMSLKWFSRLSENHLRALRLR